MNILAAEHVSRMGLDDAFSTQLATLLERCKNPLDALTQCNWTIPPHDELAAMAPEVRSVALLPIVGIEVSRLFGRLRLGHEGHYTLSKELIDAGIAALGSLPARWSDVTQPRVRDFKSHAWTAVRRSISQHCDFLNSPQVAWSPETGDPIGGQLETQLAPPFNTLDATNWDGIFPALRALFDCCQDDTDRAMIKARWAGGRCVTEGFVAPIRALSEQLDLPEREVRERLLRLRYRWGCYINRTQRFTKHLPAMPHRHYVST